MKEIAIGNMKFLCFLNSGCIDICKNMLISAENVGINMDDFYIACLDSNAYEKMNSYKNAFLYLDQKITNYQEWSFDEGTEFRNIVKHKWKLIEEIHNQFPNLCWVDVDIVFKQNPIPYISNDSFILFQSDSPDHDGPQNWICTGFMVFNGEEYSYEFISECAIHSNEDDQLIANKVANKYFDNINLLQPELFPNGNVYYNHGMKDNVVIVHNNWMKGIDIKIQKFKEENLWFL